MFSTIAAGKDTDKERARKHFKAGMSLLATENYKVAAEEFESSTRLYPTKNGYFNLAACYFELRRFNEAVATIERLKKTFAEELDETWQNEIAGFEEKLKGAIVPVEFRTNIENVTIKLDGGLVPGATTRDVPFYIDPGDHVVTLSAEGYETINESIHINAGQGRTVLQFVMVRLSEEGVGGEEEELLEQDTTHPVQFKNQNDDGPRKRRRIGTAIAFGIGGAAGLAAIATGVIHLVGVSKIRDECGGDYCEDQDLKSSVDKMKKLGVATNVLISVSAVGIVTGTILAFVEGRSKKETQRVSVGPSVWGDGGGVLLSGKF